MTWVLSYYAVAAFVAATAFGLALCGICVIVKRTCFTRLEKRL